MRSSLKKLRAFGAGHKNDRIEEKKKKRPTAKLDELVEASQDMQDMRSCYDGLLSVAAAAANSAFEFSEALEEMGTCLLEKTSLSDDEESGRALLMLGKVQFKLRNLINEYRSHIIQTITTPSESLLKELQIVEDMKHQCDDKRDLYKFLSAAQRNKGKLRLGKGERFSLQQMQAAQEAYEEDAALFVFRLKSLKQGQSRSLLTQAARHHAAQLNFFRKGLKSLEVIEPLVKEVADQQHIDYHFNGLGDSDAEDYDTDDDSYDSTDDGELSLDYGQNDHDQCVSTPRISIEMQINEVDHTVSPSSTFETEQEITVSRQTDLLTSWTGPKGASKSAPITPQKILELSNKMKETQTSSRKFHSYVLPTPGDIKGSPFTGLSNTVSEDRMESKTRRFAPLWHSSPLEPNIPVNKFTDYDDLQHAPGLPTSKSVREENNVGIDSMRTSPLAAQPPLQQYTPDTFSASKMKGSEGFSGPLPRKLWSSGPIFPGSDSRFSVEHPSVAGMQGRMSTERRSMSPKVSPSTSPPPTSTPKIRELHELPRPPNSSARSTRPPDLIGHSAPLMPRSQEHHRSSDKQSVALHTASPLPTPPGAVPRSFSIPVSSQRTTMVTVSKLLAVPYNPKLVEITSPPLAHSYLSKDIRPTIIA